MRVLLAGAAKRRVLAACAAAFLATTAIVPLTLASLPSDAATTTAATAGQLPGSFADLVEQVSPAVVSIVTTQPAPAVTSQPQLPPDSPFAPFFRDFRMPGMPEMPEAPAPQQRRESQAVGSGFIIDPEGYVVTNNHVVAEASKVAVVLQDGTRLDAEIVGRDDKSDLALLKVESDRDLPHLEFGDSDGVRVGDWTIAVGNPFGLGGTVTAGIVSARGRDINSGPYDDYLQIDAPINRGNSGGPTFDVHGNVIGINTAIFSPTGGNVGIGFAIPSNLAEPLLAQLREQGHVTRGWLGVQIQQVTPPIAESLGLDEAKGALVAQVTPDSPAAAAGLQTGDVVVAFKGQPIETVRELTRSVALSALDQTHELTVVRKGQQHELEVELRQAPDQLAMAEAPVEAVPADVMGLKLAALDAEARKAAGLSEDATGVVVVGAEGDAALQFRQGDVILSVDNEPVTSPDEVAERVAAAKAAEHPAVLVLIRRDGGQHFATLDIRDA